MKTDNPKKWGINNPFSLENLSLYLKEEQAGCSVAKQKYDSEFVELICVCGNKYRVSWSNLITNKQYQCPACSKRSVAEKNRMDEQ